MQEENNMLEKKSSRRSFLKKSGIAVGGLVLGGSLGSLFTSKKESSPHVVVDGGAEANYADSLQFFRRKADFDAISAAMETIYPEDEHGPGAIALGAPYYLDKQLAGPWGFNADDYRKAPFQEGEIPLNNSEIMLAGARKLNDLAKEKHDKANFKELDEEQKISILQLFEANEVEIAYVPSAVFFNYLRVATLQGCFCDPVYGGNKNMAGWKMKEFPGAQMSYLQYAESKEFVTIAPVSVGGHSH